MAELLKESRMQLNALSTPTDYFDLNYSVKSISSDFAVEGAAEFWKLINSLLDQQVEISAKLVKDSNLEDMQRRDFIFKLDPELNDLIHDKTLFMDDYIKQFFTLGKEQGFTEMKVASFTGAADINALYYLTNYNFDLVRQLSDTLRTGIREEIWKGVAKDRSYKEIAKRLEKVPMQPLLTKNGRMISVEDRSKMVAHTESVRARNQGLINSFQEYAVDSVDVIGHKWKGGPCVKICLPIINNGPYLITELPRGGPPFHTLCHCSLIAASTPAKKASDPEEFMNLVTGEVTGVNSKLVVSV